MQSNTVDQKLAILFDNYKDRQYARDAQRDVDTIRTKAKNWGLGITTGAFVLNEVARMSMRSRKLV